MSMTSFTTEAFTLLALGLFIIGARTYSRFTQVGIRGFEVDDWVMLFAAVVYSAETALAYSVGVIWHGIANNNMTDEQRKNIDPSSEEYYLRIGGSKTQIAGWCTYTLLLWLLKLCMCTFYVRLTTNLLGYRTRINIGFALIVITWLTVLCCILFGCGLPFEKNWQIYPNPGNFCQPAISKLDIIITVVLNVVTDLYLMTIPLPMLWQATLPLVQKVALAVCFSGGLFVTMAGILRCIYIITDPVNGAQTAGSWAVRETFVAVLTTNLPMLWKFLRVIVVPILGSFASRSRSFSGLWRTNNPTNNPNHHNKRRGGGSRTPEPGSFQLHDTVISGGSGSRSRVDKLSSGKRPPKTLYPITVLSESEERIMSDEMKGDGDGATSTTSTTTTTTTTNNNNNGNRRNSRHAIPPRTPGIEVKREFDVSVEESTSSYRSDRADADAYIHPKNTTAGVSVISKM